MSMGRRRSRAEANVPLAFLLLAAGIAAAAQEPPADLGALIYLDAGRFLMGAPTPAGRHAAAARPAHMQDVPEFFLGKYEVTAAEYCAFLNDVAESGSDPNRYVACRTGGKRATTVLRDGAFFSPRQGYEYAPATDVTYLGARRYCEWLAQRTGEPYRLPSEEEWEYAARGAEGRAYPWGDQPDTGRACLKQPQERGAPNSRAVGACPDDVTPEGVHDLIGNAPEWCGNVYFAYSAAGRTPGGPRWLEHVAPEIPWNDLPVCACDTTKKGACRGVAERWKGLPPPAWARWKTPSIFGKKNPRPIGFRLARDIVSPAPE